MPAHLWPPNRRDGIVLASVLSLALAAWAAGPLHGLIVPAARARGVWYYDVVGDLTRSDRRDVTPALFVDRTGAVLPEFFADDLGMPGNPVGTGEPLPAAEVSAALPRGQVLAYRARPDLPLDPWGRPFWLCVRPDEERPPARRSVYSGGPNRRLEWGSGDDILVAYPGSATRGWPVRPQDPLLALAILLGLGWLSARAWPLPRATGPLQEASRTTLSAALPMFLAAYAAEGVNRWGGHAPWPVLSPGPLLNLAAPAAVWGGAFLIRRGRWPAESEGEEREGEASAAAAPLVTSAAGSDTRGRRSGPSPASPPPRPRHRGRGHPTGFDAAIHGNAARGWQGAAQARGTTRHRGCQGPASEPDAAPLAAWRPGRGRGDPWRPRGCPVSSRA